MAALPYVATPRACSRCGATFNAVGRVRVCSPCRTPQPKPRRGPSLVPTARENQVIECVKRGLPNKVIAFEIGITVGTVKAHLFSIFSKLGVSNRTELALRAVAVNAALDPLC